MVTKEQLSEIGFHRVRGTEYYDGLWSYMFCIKAQEIFNHSEVDGELTFICRVSDIEHLEEVLYLDSGRDFRYEQAMDTDIYGA